MRKVHEKLGIKKFMAFLNILGFRPSEKLDLRRIFGLRILKVFSVKKSKVLDLFIVLGVRYLRISLSLGAT